MVLGDASLGLTAMGVKGSEVASESCEKQVSHVLLTQNANCVPTFSERLGR